MSGVALVLLPGQRRVRRGLSAGVATVGVVAVPAGSIAVGLSLVAGVLWSAMVADVRTQRIPNSTTLLAGAAVVYLALAAGCLRARRPARRAPRGCVGVAVEWRGGAGARVAGDAAVDRWG
jgi:hypothetical protein